LENLAIRVSRAADHTANTLPSATPHCTAVIARARASIRLWPNNQAAGMRYATVGTGGDPSHEPARRAYEKAGFSVHIPSVYMYREL
jgi:hypothetical protein